MYVLPSKVTAVVSSETGIDIKSLLAHDRSWDRSWPRQLLMMLLKEYCHGISYPDIGKIMNRHHTTIMHGEKAARDRILAVPVYAILYQRIKTRLDALPDKKEAA